ncbi:glycosyltransferase family 4 protein [Pleomorphovibrio marinus]|uniref:glycosyltransferase family 4 protein n=1 Tax=Pleomorphovibrio marinus TaxID=2164132 RepID=UPI000E0C407B|nr:glycosyltransferase family 4 protein [Pleomorphovibrio marinus]
MRICIITNSFPTKANPFNQIFVKKFQDELVKQGMDVQLFYNPIFRIWGNANKVKNFFANLLKYVFFFFSFIPFLLKNGLKVDVFFTQGIIFCTLAAVLYKKISGTPVVCYVHGGDLNRLYRKKNLSFKILKYSLDNSDYIIVNSINIYNKTILVTNNINIKIISPGVDLSVMKPLMDLNSLKKKYSIPSDKKFFLLAGNAIKRKGFDLFLGAISKLEPSITSRIFVVILTDGPEKELYNKIIADNGLLKFTSLRGKVFPQELNDYYNMADFFIFPSRQEPLGLVGLEAMTSKTIVIGSNVGGIPEFVIPGVTGLLFENGNVDSLADCIIKVLKPEFNASNYFAEIEKMIFKHSLSNSVKSFIQIFKTVKK